MQQGALRAKMHRRGYARIIGRRTTGLILRASLYRHCRYHQLLLNLGVVGRGSLRERLEQWKIILRPHVLERAQRIVDSRAIGR